jgi:hypothetical protein
MRSKIVLSRTVLSVFAVAAVIAATLITVGALAPTTEGLALQATSHIGTAAVGNRNEAFVLVSAYNAAGSIRGLAVGSFAVTVVAAPENANPLKRVVMTEPVSGVYKISLAPELSSHRWSAGKYTFAIALTSANGSGVCLAEIVIP